MRSQRKGIAMDWLLWVGIGLLFVVVEIVSLGLVLIMFAGGAFAAAIANVAGAPVWGPASCNHQLGGAETSSQARYDQAFRQSFRLLGKNQSPQTQSPQKTGATAS